MTRLRNVAGVVAAMIAMAGSCVGARADDGPASKEGKGVASPSTGAGVPTGKSGGKSGVAFPHPLISEVLYAVPNGEEGDADQSGERDAIGDEFVELVNPHDKPIELEGYRLTDGLWHGPSGASKGEKDKPGADKSGDDESADDRTSNFEFVFPKLTLAPGEVVVVFNGYKSQPKGEVGSDGEAGQKNAEFHDAYVFSTGNESKYAAFSNVNDMVLLVSPEGDGVQCVRWNNPAPSRGKAGASEGEPREGEGKAPAKPKGATRDKKPGPKHAEVKADLVEAAPRASGSVVRQGGKWIEHVDADTTLFSPGRWEKD